MWKVNWRKLLLICISQIKNGILIPMNWNEFQICWFHCVCVCSWFFVHFAFFCLLVSIYFACSGLELNVYQSKYQKTKDEKLIKIDRNFFLYSFFISYFEFNFYFLSRFRARFSYCILFLPCIACYCNRLWSFICLWFCRLKLTFYQI